MVAQPDQAATVEGGRQVSLLPAPAGTAPRFRPGDQPPPVPNCNPSLHDLAVDDIRRCLAASAEIDAAVALMLERKRIGLERYGSLLQAGNGRDWRRDLSEELADAAVYALQGIEEPDPPHGIDDIYEDILTLLCRVTGMDAEGGEPS